MQPVQTVPPVSWLPAYFGFFLGFVAIVVGLEVDALAGTIFFIIAMVVFIIQAILLAMHETTARRAYLAGMQ
jgi:hypothetical protein